VGDRRWQAPVEPDPWAEPLDATTFGPASVQLGTIFGPGLNNTCDATVASSLYQAVGSEDCLTLNIWRPTTEDTDLPVLYFIYGGANITGFTADPVYDGAALARAANAVVVTANYRLGVFGWLNLPHLKTGDALGDSGNFGTLDQILTLRFIQRNIAQFGGDAGKVTAMGQSAGAMDVYALLSSPLVVDARPQLIHRAVLMSGGLALPTELPPGSIPTLLPPSYSLAQGTALLHGLLIAEGLTPDDASAAAFVAGRSSAQVAEYLRSKSPGEILRQVLTKLLPTGLGTSSLIPEGGVVANSPLAAFAAGRYLKVPLMVSTTKDEAKLFPHFLALSPVLGGQHALIVSDAQRFYLMMAFDAEAPPSLSEKDLINPAYLPVDAPVTGYDARMSLLNQFFFIHNRDAMLQALSAQQGDIWYYEFRWNQAQVPWNDVYGAAHAFDLPFLFGNFGPSCFANVINSRANEGGRLALSKAMMAALGAFAWQGDPNHAELGVAWPTWPRTLILDATLTEKTITVV
jgi:para-nitrobenzyl esterase